MPAQQAVVSSSRWEIAASLFPLKASLQLGCIVRGWPIAAKGIKTGSLAISLQMKPNASFASFTSFPLPLLFCSRCPRWAVPARAAWCAHPNALIGRKHLPGRAVPHGLVTSAKLKAKDFESEFERGPFSLQWGAVLQGVQDVQPALCPGRTRLTSTFVSVSKYNELGRGSYVRAIFLNLPNTLSYELLGFSCLFSCPLIWQVTAAWAWPGLVSSS